LSFTLPEGVYGDSLMFGIGTEDNIHGFLVSGDGAVNLQTFANMGVDQSEISSSDYTTSGGKIVSPVYKYQQSGTHPSDHADLDIVAEIEDGQQEKIYIINGSVADASAQYVKNSQTLDATGFFDVIRMTDGEILVIYDQSLSDFTVGDNSISASGWQVGKGVMIAGTSDNYFEWGTPLKKGFDENDTEHGGWKYPIMVINTVSYMSYIYNPLNNIITIFVKAVDDEEGVEYIGAYALPILDIDKNLFLAEVEEDVVGHTPFLWRATTLDDSFLSDFSKSWLSEQSYYSQDVPESDIVEEYVRVLGPPSTNCQISMSSALDTIFTSMMPDATYLMIYNNVDGIKMAFSTNGGRIWMDNDIIIADDGTEGILMGETILYVSIEGIKIIHTNISDIYQVRTVSQKKQEGNDVATLEETIQTTYDEMDRELIGSGIIPSQRISGYVTTAGVMKVFYYNDRNALVCMESSDKGVWKVADNF